MENLSWHRLAVDGIVHKTLDDFHANLHRPDSTLSEDMKEMLKVQENMMNALAYLSAVAAMTICVRTPDTETPRGTIDVTQLATSRKALFADFESTFDSAVRHVSKGMGIEDPTDPNAATREEILAELGLQG